MQFNVAMNHAVGVTVLDGIHKLDEYLARIYFVQFAVLVDMVGKLATTGKFHNHYKLIALNKGMVELYNVSVMQLLNAVSLFIDIIDFIGSGKSVRHIHEFYGVLFVVKFIGGEIDSAKTTLAKHIAHNIVIQNSTVVKRFAFKCYVEHVVFFYEV